MYLPPPRGIDQKKKPGASKVKYVFVGMPMIIMLLRPMCQFLHVFQFAPQVSRWQGVKNVHQNFKSKHRNSH